MDTTVLITIHSGGFSRKSNSLEYLEAACALHPDILEVDVRATKDGEIVLSHDVYHPIQQSSCQELRSGCSPFLSLQTVLSNCLEQAICVNLDIKEIDAIDSVCALLASRTYQDTVVFSGCQEAELARLFSLMPQARALYNADRWDTSEPYLQYASAMVERTLACGAFALNICHEDLLDPLVRICHSKNLPLYVWTVDEAVRMRQLLQMGVSSITTHDVELLRAVLAEH